MNKITSRLIVLTVLMSVITLSARARLNFSPDKTYRIVSMMYAGGSLLTGSAHGSEAPIFYSETDETSADAYWTFTLVHDSLYTIRNASTGEYVTYDGERTDHKRYVGLTSEISGENSYWSIVISGDGFVISRPTDSYSRMNIRMASGHLVGTYDSNSSPSANEIFYFEDAAGTRVEDVTNYYEDGTYGNDSVDGYWENNGIAEPVVFTTDVSNPVIYKIRNVRSGQDIILGSGNVLAQTSDNSVATGFYFVKASDGISIYTADGSLYVSGLVQSNSYVYAFSGTPSSSENWTLSHSSDYSGYAISNSSGQYWNDYYQQYVGYYSLDAGSTFLFYSTDARHKSYLESLGYDFSGAAKHDQSLFSSYIDTLLIDGKAPVYDQLYGTYMLPVREKYRDGSDFNVPMTVKLKDASVSLAIDGKTATDGENMNLGNVSGGVTKTMTLNRGTEVLSEVKVTFTFLPIVEVRAGLFSTNTYNSGTIRVTDPDVSVAGDTMVIAKYRLRGATAASKKKKSYAIKLYDSAGNSLDRSFLSMRSDNNWILDAMAIDRARMRNRVSTDLWLDFSTKPYQTEFKKKAVNGTHGRFVEVLLNGKYAGIYCMTEKVDRKQLQLRKIKEAATAAESDTVRGVLYKSSGWSYSTFMGHDIDTKSYPGVAVSAANSSSENWDSWEAKYPDLADASYIDWEPLRDAINVPAKGNYRTTFNSKVAEYFDLPVFRDYYLFIELMLASDNHGKNLYLYNYDITQSKKFSLTPWDLDGTWGMRWDGSEINYITADATKDFVTFLWDFEHGENTLYHYLSTYNYDSWNDSLALRYASLRGRWFNPDSLYARFASYRQLFKDSGADSREVKRWDGSDNIPLDFDTEMSFLKNWITTRVATLDKEYNFDPSVLGIHSVTASGNVNVSGGEGVITIVAAQPARLNIYTPDGMLFRTVSVARGDTILSDIPTGIYIVGGRKVFVR